MPKDFGAATATAPAERVPVRLTRGGAPRGLPHQSNAPFRYKWHPARFHYVDGKGWLPTLGTIVLDLGLSGVDKGGDDTLAIVQAEKRGWRVLPLDCVPPGTPDGQYLHGYPTQDGGTFHCSAWETPNAEGGRVGTPATLTDVEGYHHFLAWLVEEGHVAHATDNARSAVVAMDRVRVAELAKRAGKSALLVPEYERALERHQAMAGEGTGEPEQPPARVKVKLPRKASSEAVE